MPEIWPASLPNRSAFGPSVPFGNNLASFQPDGGPSIDRTRFTVASGEWEYSRRISWAQAETFRNFYENTLQPGNKTFTGILDPMLAVNTHKIKPDSVKLTPVRGGRVTLSMTLQVVPS